MLDFTFYALFVKFDTLKVMKKETLVVLFYFLYFVWLFSVTFLTGSTSILNYYLAFVSVFYFLFLREPGDFLWFWFGASVPIFTALFSFTGWQPSFNLENLYYLPIWLPLAWGTTIVALRKFFVIVTR